MFQFGDGRGDVKRYGDTTGSPDAVECDYIVGTCRNKKSYALLIQVVTSREQATCKLIDARVDVVIGILPACVNQGGLVVGSLQDLEVFTHCLALVANSIGSFRQSSGQIIG